MTCFKAFFAENEKHVCVKHLDGGWWPGKHLIRFPLNPPLVAMQLDLHKTLYQRT